MSEDTILAEPLRIFVTHSSNDRPFADVLVKRLGELSAQPVIDVQDIPPGVPFNREIRDLISKANVFIPLLTKNSKSSPWVNQEIGFALGQMVPVYPISFSKDYIGGIAEEIHSLIVRSNEDSTEESMVALDKRLEEKLTLKALRDLASPRIDQSAHIPRMVSEWADDSVKRTRLIVKHAGDAWDKGVCRVRQRAAFTSFGIPDRPQGDAVWKTFDGPKERTEKTLRELLRDERQLLEQCARKFGCDLIIQMVSARQGDESTLMRRRLLRQFIESMAEENGDIRIAVLPDGEELFGNLTIVGSWFVADAAVPLIGSQFRGTLFSTHGPTVLKEIEKFEKVLNDFRITNLDEVLSLFPDDD